jgi:hypothetical protein
MRPGPKKRAVEPLEKKISMKLWKTVLAEVPKEVDHFEDLSSDSRRILKLREKQDSETGNT